MKKLWLAVAVGVFCLTPFSASGIEDVKKGGPDTGRQAGLESSANAQAEANEKKDEYQKRIEAQLDEYDRRIAELESRAKEFSGRKRIELEDAIKKLKPMQESARGELEKLKASGESAWDEIRSELDKRVTEVRNFIDKAAADVE